MKGFGGADQTELVSFFAYDTTFTGGVTVTTADINGDGVSDILTGAGPGGGPHVRAFDGTDTTLELANFFAFDSLFTGGVFVGSSAPLIGQPPSMDSGSMSLVELADPVEEELARPSTSEPPVLLESSNSDQIPLGLLAAEFANDAFMEGLLAVSRFCWTKFTTES